MQNKIIQRASQLFLELGFKTVTMDVIAQDMGISKKTIYSHFENKTSLVEATILKIFSTISEGAACIYGSGENPIDEFFSIRDYIISTLTKQKPIARYQLQKFYPEIYSDIQAKQLGVIMTCLKENLIRGQELGLYRQEVDIDFASRIYYASMNITKDPVIFPPEQFELPYLFKQVISHFLFGICTPKGIKILNNHLETN